MTSLEELWQDLFGRRIGGLERMLMQGVVTSVDEDDNILILSAIITRMLYVVLIADKASPFQVLRGFGRTMEDHHATLHRLSTTAARFKSSSASSRARSGRAPLS